MPEGIRRRTSSPIVSPDTEERNQRADSKRERERDAYLSRQIFLKQGSKGPAVREYQEKLARRIAEIRVGAGSAAEDDQKVEKTKDEILEKMRKDGKGELASFGEETERLTRELQTAMKKDDPKVQVDGQAGRQTHSFVVDARNKGEAYGKEGLGKEYKPYGKDKPNEKQKMQSVFEEAARRVGISPDEAKQIARSLESKGKVPKGVDKDTVRKLSETLMEAASSERVNVDDWLGYSAYDNEANTNRVKKMATAWVDALVWAANGGQPEAAPSGAGPATSAGKPAASGAGPSLLLDPNSGGLAQSPFLEPTPPTE